MVIITPTMNFSGRCEEALRLYQKAFHATIGCMLRYSDADKKDWNKEMSPEQGNYIYHAELFIGNQRIMLCDHIDADFVASQALSLTVTFDTREEVLEAYALLKEDSITVYPVHSTTYSSCCVVFIDKFGFRWGFMTEQTER